MGNASKVALVGATAELIALGQAIRRALPQVQVVIHDRDREAMQRAQQVGAAQRAEWHLPSACQGAAAIFVAGALSELELTLRATCEDLHPQSLFASVGLPAAAALAAANRYLAAGQPFFATRLSLSPALPADAAPLHGAVWASTPRASIPPDAVDTFAAFVQQLEAQPVFLEAAEQDGIAFAVEELPALVSSALLLALSGDRAWAERQWMAGEALNNATHLVERAAQLVEPLMHQRQIAIHWLNQVMLQCIALRDALQDEDKPAIERLLRKAQETRAQWLAERRVGRRETAPRVQPQSNWSALLGLLVGERAAERLAGKWNKT
ncbi:MAG: hypothetical protein ACK4WM_04155 [Thermoflexales bacterium]